MSRIGFGCWPIGGHGWGRTDDAASVAAVAAALDAGINFFDTADVYGFGHSEELLARALGAHRRHVVVASKFGVRWDASSTTWRDTSPQWLDRALDASLRRLRLDSIPLYQVHWDDGVTPLEAVIERLCRHREAGKVQEIGICNAQPRQIARIAAAARVVSMQTGYNAVDRGAEDGVFGACRDADIDVVTHSSLAQGLCSGKYGSGATFGADDVRSRSPYFNGGYAANMAVVSRMRRVGARYGRTPAQVALGWVLGAGQVASALVGIKTAEQVRENAEVLWNMDEADRAYIANGTIEEAAGQTAVAGVI